MVFIIFIIRLFHLILTTWVLLLLQFSDEGTEAGEVSHHPKAGAVAGGAVWG